MFSDLMTFYSPADVAPVTSGKRTPFFVVARLRRPVPYARPRVDQVLNETSELKSGNPRGSIRLRLTPECFRLCFYPSVGVFGRSTIVALNGDYDRSFGGVYTHDG